MDLTPLNAAWMSILVADTAISIRVAPRRGGCRFVLDMPGAIATILDASMASISNSAPRSAIFAVSRAAAGSPSNGKPSEYSGISNIATHSPGFS